MDGIQINNRLKYEEASNLFGDDIGELISSLLGLDNIQLLHKRIFLKPNINLNLSDFEHWVLSNIGLPEWVSPHLNIKLEYSERFEGLILAEHGDDIIILSQGGVLLKKNNTMLLLNSNLLNFLKSIILHQHMIEQALLVFGGDTCVDGKLPIFMHEYFIEMLRLIDKINLDTWKALGNRNVR